MFKPEARATRWIQKHILPIGLGGALVLSLFLRYSLRGWILFDMENFLMPWYKGIEAQGLPAFLQAHNSDYHVPYQVLLGLCTLLPFTPVVNIKIGSVLFDYLVAAAMGYGVWQAFSPAGGAFTQEARRRRKMLTGGSAIITMLLPIPIANSAIWGQCDIIYTFFLLNCTLLLMREKYTPAFICFAIGLAFKFQAIFYLPVLVILYFVKRKFSILQFLWAPALLFIIGLPARASGDSLFFGFEIYTRQTGIYQLMTYNYPNLHMALNEVPFADHALPAVLTALAVLFAFLVYVCATRREIAGDGVVLLAVWCILTCTMFLPAMHDRYGFAAELLVWLYFLLNPSLKRLVLGLCVNFVPLCIYIRAFVNVGIFTLNTYAVINMLSYTLVSVALVRRLKNMGGAGDETGIANH